MKVKYLPEHTPDYVEKKDWTSYLSKQFRIFAEVQQRWEAQIIRMNNAGWVYGGGNAYYIAPQPLRADVWVPEPEPEPEEQEGIPDYPPNPHEEEEAEILN